MTDFTFRRHPEKNIDGFTALDGTVGFYAFVKAAMLRTRAREVLDFGAGRGAFWHDDTSLYRRHMHDLRTTGATVTACDVDEVVLTHPCSHSQVVIKPDAPLPFPDATFDVIVSDMTFEHIEAPARVGAELLRVLKPGGYICARTPSRTGYVRLVSGLIPNWLHVAALKRIQPGRKAEDVFPIYYRLNSPAQVRAAFPGCEVYHYYHSAEPAYYFGRKSLYAMLQAFHKLMPAKMATAVCFFIREPAKGDTTWPGMR